MTPPKASQQGTAPAKPVSGKLIAFRILAVAIPSALGLAAIAALLVKQQRLVIEPGDGETARPPIRFQSAPIYLEEPDHEITGQRYLYDETLGWKNIPSWESATFDRKIAINSKGLRDREYPYEKPAGVFRILVLGDSFVWGYGVSNEETFTERLEQALTAEGAAIEVLNAGVSGWGTDQQLLYLESEGFKYSPELVVLAFFLYNDPENILNSRQYGLQKPIFVNTNLQLANVPVPEPGASTEPLTFKGNPLKLAVPLIDRMARECRAHDAKLLVMKFGAYMFSAGQNGDFADRRFRELLEPVTGIARFDLDADLNRRGVTGEQLKAGRHKHWNATGHQWVADALRDNLAKQALLPGSAAQSRNN